ncbi:MAG: DUF2786 domain-containing protein [Gordonia sp. (in: high G+C Gram-positive bacteria)]|nr:MAG: DUF2786 domain-containing protein [Gordonia sp. (in: high G+C Gram-positive bacteria)]
MTTESTHFDRAKMTERVGKLFAKAASTSSEEEASALLERAFALSAKYGIDETLARSGGDVDAAEIITATIDITGRYQPDQVGLIASVGGALHCKVVTSQDGQKRRKAMVVGARRHVDRVVMLSGFLRGIMVARAARARSPHPSISTVAHRKSFMTGFAFEVGSRLSAAESNAVDGSVDTKGAALVLASDADRAAAELARQFPTAVRGRRRKVSTSGIDEGRTAASDLDLGQTKVGGHRHAISA